MVPAVTLRVGRTLSVALAVTVLGCGRVEGGLGAEGGSGGDSALGGTDALGGASFGGGGGAVGVAGGTPSASQGGATSFGAAGAPIAGSAGMGGGRAPFTGTWAMFVFEDPVMVQIAQDGQTLSGRGCCAGFKPSLSHCCGELTGMVEGNFAKFSFVAGDARLTYGTSVVLSEDGERMGGYFGLNGALGMKVAWVRPPNLETWLPPDPSLAQLLKSRNFEVAGLRLVSPHTGPFTPGKVYHLYLDMLGGSVLIHGDFGPFYNDEMVFDSARQVLRVGPVPATDPTLAESLELQFDGDTLVSVVATYADDDTPYSFEVVSRVR